MNADLVHENEAKEALENDLKRSKWNKQQNKAERGYTELVSVELDC